MPLPLFQAPRAKVKRARSLIAELEALEASLIHSPPFLIVPEQHPEKDGYWRCVIRECIELPEDTPLLLGDAIHNLRTSLDLLACDLVRANNNDPKNVYFPFCEQGDDLEKMIKRRNINRCAPDVIELIRSMKPYKGGNDALRAIHDLDIADKHQLLIPTLMAVLHPSLDLDFVNQVYIQRPIDECVMSISDGAVILDDIPNDKTWDAFKDKKHVTMFVFDVGQPLAGESVTPTLQDLAKLVDGIVETFASHILRSDT